MADRCLNSLANMQTPRQCATAISGRAQLMQALARSSDALDARSGSLDEAYPHIRIDSTPARITDANCFSRVTYDERLILRAIGCRSATAASL